MTKPTTRRTELAHRTSGAIDIYLFWEQRTNRVTVGVLNVRTGNSFELDIDPPDALDAFYHPYAYAARLETAGRGRAARSPNRIARNGRS